MLVENGSGGDDVIKIMGVGVDFQGSKGVMKWGGRGMDHGFILFGVEGKGRDGMKGLFEFVMEAGMRLSWWVGGCVGGDRCLFLTCGLK